MKSKIYSKEIVVQYHAHKASEVYYPCVFRDQAGRDQKLLLTAKEVENAKSRAKVILIADEEERPWWKLW